MTVSLARATRSSRGGTGPKIRRVFQKRVAQCQVVGSRTGTGHAGPLMRGDGASSFSPSASHPPSHPATRRRQACACLLWSLRDAELCRMAAASWEPARPPLPADRDIPSSKHTHNAKQPPGWMTFVLSLSPTPARPLLSLSGPQPASLIHPPFYCRDQRSRLDGLRCQYARRTRVG